MSDGQLPVVLDPYTFVFSARDDPEYAVILADRIDRKEFDAVLLSKDDPGDSWYRHYFGPAVMDAIAKSYTVTGTVGGQYLFTRRQSPT